MEVDHLSAYRSSEKDKLEAFASHRQPDWKNSPLTADPGLAFRVNG